MKMGAWLTSGQKRQVSFILIRSINESKQSTRGRQAPPAPKTTTLQILQYRQHEYADVIVSDLLLIQIKQQSG
jgi:hypothetical protein